MLDWMERGGPYMWVLLAALLSHVATLVVQLVRRRDAYLLPILWASVPLLVLLGTLGSVDGFVSILKCRGVVGSSEIGLYLSGMSIALQTTWFGLLFAGLAMVGAGIATAVVRRPPLLTIIGSVACIGTAAFLLATAAASTAGIIFWSAL